MTLEPRMIQPMSDSTTTAKGAHRFHPAVASWFAANLGAPTPCQEQAWEAVAAGRHSLIAAPTSRSPSNAWTRWPGENYGGKLHKNSLTSIIYRAITFT